MSGSAPRVAPVIDDNGGRMPHVEILLEMACIGQVAAALVHSMAFEAEKTSGDSPFTSL